MPDFQVNKRLKQIIEEYTTRYDISVLKFAEKYGDNKAVKTYHIINQRNGVSSKMLDLITDSYPEINKNYLLTGEGEKFIAETSDKFLFGNQTTYEKNAQLVKEIKHIAFKEKKSEEEVLSEIGLDTAVYKELKEGNIKNVGLVKESLVEYQTKRNKFVHEPVGNRDKLLDVVLSQQRSIEQLSEASLMNAETMKNLFNKLNEK